MRYTDTVAKTYLYIRSLSKVRQRDISPEGSLIVDKEDIGENWYRSLVICQPCPHLASLQPIRSIVWIPFLFQPKNGNITICKGTLSAPLALVPYGIYRYILGPQETIART